MLHNSLFRLIRFQNQSKCLQMVQKRFIGLPKKFFKIATVKLNDNEQYEIKLDKRTLKTPKGKLFEVINESLAQAISQEWNSQQDTIKRDEMHLTTLVNTQLDNPCDLTKQKIIENLVDQLSSDTLCYRVSEPEDLNKLLKNSWNPIIEQFENTYQCNIPVTEGVFLNEISAETKKKISQYLNSFEFNSLFGLQFVVDNLKSLILAISLINKLITVDEAVRLSRLEQEFQIQRWGHDWNHDLDLNLLRSRVSAGLMHFLLTNEYHKQRDTCNHKQRDTCKSGQLN